MKVFLSLTGLYLKSFYNLPGKAAKGTKFDPKAALKTLGIGLLVLLVVGQMGFLFGASNMATYEALAPLGLQGIVLLNVAVIATILTLAIGFLTALSTYFMNDMELQFLAMPIKPRELFAAKFAAIYVSEAAISIFFVATALVIFGIKEAPHPLFYIWGFKAALLLPLPALAISYLIQIPLMGFARFLKNKQTILVVGGVIGLVMALGFNIYYQTMLGRLQDPAWIAANMAGPDALLTKLGRSYPPAYLTWRALSAPASWDAVLSLLGLAAVCVAGPALVILGLSGRYAKSLVGFNESHIKKLGAGADAFLRAKLVKRPAFLSLVARELRMMNREPMYMLNGPFIIVLMPVILGIMVVVQRDAFLGDPDMAGLLAMMQGGAGAIVAALSGVFLGSATSITCTSLSRDAKALPYLKSLPISAGRYMLAKLVHGLAFAAFGSAMGVGLVAYALRLGLGDIAAAFGAALAMGALLNLGGLWLDTANPRLRWDNPIAAMKQNPNAVIAIFGAMGLAGGGSYLAFTTGMSTGAFALWFGLVPAAAFVALLLPYPRYAARRLAAIEV